MLSFLENVAKHNNCSLIKLEVNKNNTPAIAAYKKNGFVIDCMASEESMYMQKLL